MTGRRIKTSFAVSLAAGFAMMLPAPQPRIVIQSPNLMYALAYYDIAVGHTGEAAKLVSEAGKKTARQSHSSQTVVMSSRVCPLPSKS